MDQMMAETQRVFATLSWAAQDRTIEAALRQMPQGGSGVSSVIVTSFSDGRSTCTRRVTYTGNGAAPKVDVSATGDGCTRAGIPAGDSVPAALPDIQPQQRTIPHTLRVENRSRLAPMEVAQLGN
ncbi:MAG: hypothetical protein WDN49_23210 [Acetobacteraceae bacterium]